MGVKFVEPPSEMLAHLFEILQFVAEDFGPLAAELEFGHRLSLCSL